MGACWKPQRWQSRCKAKKQILAGSMRQVGACAAAGTELQETQQGFISFQFGEGMELYIAELPDGRLNLQEIFLLGGPQPAPQGISDEARRQEKPQDAGSADSKEECAEGGASDVPVGERLRPVMRGDIEAEPAFYQAIPVDTHVTGDRMRGIEEKKKLEHVVLVKVRDSADGQADSDSGESDVEVVAPHADSFLERLGEMEAETRAAALTEDPLTTEGEPASGTSAEAEELPPHVADHELDFSSTYAFSCKDRVFYRVKPIAVRDLATLEDPILRFQPKDQIFLLDSRHQAPSPPDINLKLEAREIGLSYDVDAEAEAAIAAAAARGDITLTKPKDVVDELGAMWGTAIEVEAEEVPEEYEDLTGSMDVDISEMPDIPAVDMA